MLNLQWLIHTRTQVTACYIHQLIYLHVCANLPLDTDPSHDMQPRFITPSCTVLNVCLFLSWLHRLPPRCFCLVGLTLKFLLGDLIPAKTKVWIPLFLQSSLMNHWKSDNKVGSSYLTWPSAFMIYPQQQDEEARTLKSVFDKSRRTFCSNISSSEMCFDFKPLNIL